MYLIFITSQPFINRVLHENQSFFLYFLHEIQSFFSYFLHENQSFFWYAYLVTLTQRNFYP